MREARHYRCRVLQRLLRQRPLIGRKRGIDFADGVAHPEPEVGRDLIVARACGVQAPRGRPDEFREPALDIHVDVLERPLEGELAGLDL